MRHLFVTTTISPMMMGEGQRLVIKEVGTEFLESQHDFWASKFEVVGAVGHEATAPFVEAVTGFTNLHARRNVTLEVGDIVLAVIPAIRFEVAREFTREEVDAADFRVFVGHCLAR